MKLSVRALTIVFANVILRIARARAPRLRYAVGGGAAWIPLARILLPPRLLDYAVRRGFVL
jgi:hypothetical protein